MTYSIYQKGSPVRVTMESWETRADAEVYLLHDLHHELEVREVPEPGGGKFGLREKHEWQKLAETPESELTLRDHALIAAVVLLSTNHDPQSESRSFSHLTMEECFDKLVQQY